MTDTNTAGREAATDGKWYMVNKDGMATLCLDEEDAIACAAEDFVVWPHMGPYRAVQLVEAGRASLAASAGSEPVALDPRHIRKFLQALQAGEMSVARAVEILDAWVEGRYSDDMVPPPPADSCLIADDEFPMEIVRKLRSEMATHPSPPEGAGAEQALRKVLSVVQRYLPPDGPSAHDAMSEITAIVDPWPLGPLEKP